MRALNRFDRQVIAPFAFQPTRAGLMGGFGAASSSIYSGPPTGAGAAQGAEIGAAQGASLGTQIVPVFGTAIGAVVGAIAGAIAGSIGKQDPEIQNFDQAIALWQVNPDAIYQLANKYLVLAGFFDLTSSQAGKIRIYRKYGRMGEEPFTRDFAMQIYNAAQSGVFGPTATAPDVYQHVILPWEDSWGFGPEPSNPHSDFMDRLLTGMIFDYVTGYGPAHWYSRSGPLPASFSSIPPFAFPQGATTTTSTINPVGSSATTSSAAPGPTPAGTFITAAQPNTITYPGGTFTFSGGNYLRNGGAVTATAPATAGLLYLNSQVYRYDANGATYVWNDGWVATTQVPTPPASISALISAPASSSSSSSSTSSAPATSNVQPVGSSTSTPTPQQLVASPPAIGTTVGYAPDIGNGGLAVALPAGLVFAGLDPNNHSWILENSAGLQYVLWQGYLLPYTATMFAPATTAQSGTTQTSSTTTVATTSSGQAVTQADLQALVSQLAAQGQTAQQAYTSALQALQSQGVATTPAVQSAVQSAVDSTPAPSTSNNTLLIAGGIVAVLLLTSSGSKRSRR